VHWKRVGSAWNEDGAEETDREEKPHEKAQFPCAKHAMKFDCFLTSFLQLA
jgi:hypothetical protein